MYLSQDPIGLSGGKVLYGYVPDVNVGVDVWGLSECSDAETFYRKMSEEHYDELIKSGKLKATSETFISSTREFSEEGYRGALVRFEMRIRDKSCSRKGRRTDNSVLAKNRHPNMKIGKKWTQLNAYFKTETLHTRR